MFQLLAFSLLILLHFTNGQVAHVSVKEGHDYRLYNVPGSLVVKRYTNASFDAQYLFAGNDCWTTDGTDHIGSASLSFNGTMVVHKFGPKDVGYYEFPLYQPSALPGENGQGCVFLDGPMLDINLEKPKK